LERSKKCLDSYCKQIKARIPKNGIVFEVRQGYKSKDSKRQNKEVLGYDLGGFFMKNTERIRKNINEVLEVLLNPQS